MAATVREQLGGNLIISPRVPAGWKPERCPDLAREPFADQKVPWREPITTAKVDAARTAGLASKDVDAEIEISAPGSVWEGSVHGIPFQRIDPTARAQSVLDVGRPAEPTAWQTLFGIRLWATAYRYPITAVSMPPTVRRESDPVGAAFDRHSLLLNEENHRLVEMIQLEHGSLDASLAGAEWSVGWRNNPGLAVWQLDQPWNGPTQPLGVVAAGIPMLPHLIRADEVLAGQVRHAGFLVVANYGKGRAGYARAGDGSLGADHPLRAGERLRLKASALARYKRGTAQRVVAQGLRDYGVVVGDRRQQGSVKTSAGKASISLTQDPRFDGLALELMGLRLTDFEVVDQQFALAA